MSANGDDDGDSGPGTREVAYRLFAAEFDDCDLQFSESDEERAPNYVITPTGGRVNRLFLTGVLTELEQVNETMLRARIVDPTGAFVVYAGQYQPEALSFLERAEPPAFLAVTGKARTYQPDDSEVVYSSVRPESISEVDAETRDRWVVSTAEQTLDRVGVMAAAIDSGLSGAALREHLESGDVGPALAQGVALARDHYGTTPAYLDALRDLALDATRVVANERDEAGTLDIAPDEGGEADLDTLSAGGPELEAAAGSAPPATDAVETAGTTSAADATSTTESVTASAGADESTVESGSDADGEPTTTGSGGSEPMESAAASTDTTTAADSGPTAESEPATEESAGTEMTAEPSGTDDGDDLGEFEPGEFDEEPEEDPLGDEVREQVEEEYGTEFSTGTEVESEPDLEPEAEPAAGSEPADDPTADAGVESTADPDSEPVEPATDEESAEAEPAEEPAEDVDLSEAVMDAMRDLDEGDGAPTDAVIDRVVERTGAAPDEVDEAVQDALMGGQCYEPEDGTLKPI